MKITSKSTTGTRLGAYLTAGVGLGTLAGSADAAIVTIDISAAGYNIGGPNAGLVNDATVKAGFTSSETKLTLWSEFVYGDFRSINIYNTNGAYNPVTQSYNPGGVAVSSFDSASPHKFSAGDLIGPGPLAGVVGFSANSGFSAFAYTGSSTADEFSATPKSFIGFENALGDYGWLLVTWDAPSKTFEILAGAYNDTPGVAIAAGDGLTAVPEPASVLSTMGLLASGLLLRRRKQVA